MCRQKNLKQNSRIAVINEIVKSGRKLINCACKMVKVTIITVFSAIFVKKTTFLANV